MNVRVTGQIHTKQENAYSNNLICGVLNMCVHVCGESAEDEANDDDN